MQTETILSTRNLIKTYPGVVALNDVSIDFEAGEIHALVGENGAGKSTLVKTLSGAIVPDSGQIIMDGQTFECLQPGQSKKLGIEVIYQEFNLVPSLSVAENVFMGAFEGNGVLVDFKSMQKKTAVLFAEMSVDIDPRAEVSTLSVAELQLVEIAKSLVRSARVLIMDEPTAPLTTKETQMLFSLIRELKRKGVTILYISHRFSEIFELSDRITVMRDGAKITTLPTAGATREQVVNLMVGRSLKETYPARTSEPGAPVLEVRGLSGPRVRDISLTLRQGEILGIAGLVGAGRTELMRMIFGADPIEQGEIKLHGARASIQSPRQAVERGIGYLPEDRKQHGVLVELSVRENITLPILPRISKCMVVKRREEEDILEQCKTDLRIKTPSYAQQVKNLSGGNQQKVALAKWLVSGVDILIFDEPTRGIDVGAKQEIYQLMNGLIEAGKSIIMVTSEMEELLGMSDRIIVLREGEYAGSIEDKRMFSQENVMLLASGK